MVSFVWYSLSLLGACTFPIWVMFIEGIVLEISFITFGSRVKAEWVQTVWHLSGFGYIFYSGAVLFHGLSINGWFFLLAPLWFAIAFIVPGGFTITLLVLSATGFMDVTPWLWASHALVDLICIVIRVRGFIKRRREKKLKEALVALAALAMLHDT